MSRSLLENLLAPGTIVRLGWMLVHVLWQAAVVALLLAVFLRLLRRASANARYWTACAALALMVVLPIITIRLVQVPGPVAEAGPAGGMDAAPARLSSAPHVPTAVNGRSGRMEYGNNGIVGASPAESSTFQHSPIPSFPAPRVPLQRRIVSILEPALPHVVLAWLVGVFGLSAWHLGGWAQLQRLRRRMVRAVGEARQRRFDELLTRLGMHRAVGLLESALVEVPTVVGWLRPVILLPASALTGLSPDQLEAILAHELAHIRRYDYLVNIVQTIVEILGFYHPAIWWVSHRIRIERENCCDDLAVHVCGSSLQYARALACMEEIRHTGTDLAVAATGGSLMSRIARVLGRPSVDDRRFTWLPGLITLLLVVGIVLPAAVALTAASQTQSATSEETTPPALQEIWGRLDALDKERFELARQRWEALPVTEQARRLRRGWTQQPPTEQQLQDVMTEDGARRFLAQIQKQLGTRWQVNLREFMGEALTPAEREQFNNRRQALVKEIAALGEPVVKTLIQEVRTDELQSSGAAARDALQQIGAPAVPALLEAATSAQLQPRRTLLRILVDLGDPRAAETFRRLLDDDRDPHTRLLALQGLEKLGRVSQDVYLRCLEDEYGALRRAAVAALGKIGDEQAIPALLVVVRYDLSKDKFGGLSLRKEAYQAILEISSRIGKPAPSLPADTPQNRSQLTFADFRAAALCSNTGIRREAITSLTVQGYDQDVWALLMTVLQTDASPKVREAAAMAITRLFHTGGPGGKQLELSQAEREPLFNVLLDLIGKEAVSPTPSLLYALVAVGGPYLPAYPRFPELFALALRHIEGPDRGLQRGGLFVLTRLGYEHPKAVPQYVTPEVRQRLLPRLVAGMEEPEDGYRIRFIEALGYLRERSVVPRLIQLLGHKKDVIRSFAVGALGNIGDSRALPALEDVAQHDTATDYKGDLYLRNEAGEAIEKIRAANPPGALDPQPRRKDAVNTSVQVQTAAAASAGPADQAAQILLNFEIVKVWDELRPDAETVFALAKALGGDSLLSREIQRTGSQLNLPLGEILKRYVAPQPLSGPAGEAMVNLLQSRGYLEVSARPKVLTRDGQPANVRVIGERFLASSDPNAKPVRIEYGTAVDTTCRVLDANRVNLEMKAEVSNLVPGAEFNQPTVLRTSAETNVTAWNDWYLVWAAVTPTDGPAGQDPNARSVYIMVRPRINLPPQGFAPAAEERRPDGTPARQVLLDVRTVTANHDALSALGLDWRQSAAPAGLSPSSQPSSNGPAAGAPGLQIGRAADPPSPDTLLAALDLLQKNGQAEISSQQLIAKEGHPSRIKALKEQWSIFAAPATPSTPQGPAEPHKIETGTILTVKPHVANNHAILLDLNVKTTRALPQPPGSDVPLLSQREVQSSVTLKDGGTMTVGGLSVNPTGATNPADQDVVIFVTAHVLPDANQPSAPAPAAQATADRARRIDELMARAKVYWKQGQYEAALDQLETLLVLDPLHDEAWTLKEMGQSMIALRKQTELGAERRNSGLQQEPPVPLDPQDAAVYKELGVEMDLSQLTPTTPLRTAMEVLRTSVQPPLNIVVLWHDLEDTINIQPTSPINMNGQPKVKLGTALKTLLKAISPPADTTHQADYVIDQGVIFIGTPAGLPQPSTGLELRPEFLVDLSPGQITLMRRLYANSDPMVSELSRRIGAME